MNRIIIKKGASFSMGITVPTYPNEAKPYTVAAQLKNAATSEEVILTFGVVEESPASGIRFVLSLTPEQTRSIPTPSWDKPTDLVPFVLDILVKDVNGGVIPVYQGLIYVNPVVSNFGS